MPRANRFGGWYGDTAFPGDTLFAFVGERLNDRRVGPEWPALYGGTTGVYLWRAMATAGIPLHRNYYTNAIKSPGKVVNLKSELEDEVRPEKIIALGGVASRALWKAKVSHIYIPHPAYWQRFHLNEFKIYVDILKEIHHVPTTAPRPPS